MRDFLSGGGGTVRHRRRLPEVLPLPAQPGGARRGPSARVPHGRLHGPQPPARAAPISRQFGRQLLSETFFDGVGFGLGFSATTDAVATKVLSSSGEYAWGGAGSTEFWCDPREDIAVVFLSHLRPGNTYPIPTQLKQLVYQALVD